MQVRGLPQEELEGIEAAKKRLVPRRVIVSAVVAPLILFLLFAASWSDRDAELLHSGQILESVLMLLPILFLAVFVFQIVLGGLVNEWRLRLRRR